MFVVYSADASDMRNIHVHRAERPTQSDPLAMEMELVIDLARGSAIVIRGSDEEIKAFCNSMAAVPVVA